MLKAYFSDGFIEAGCDEVGRGCLAGPVVAAAVILPRDFFHPVLTDSKLLTRQQREELREVIIKEAIAWAIAEASHIEIDEINILNASYLAMHRALDQLKTLPELLLIDGNRFKKYKSIPHQCVVKGDSLYFSIAAASILAKTYRDELMCKLASEYPCYCWHTNVGYATKAHRDAIMANGYSPFHRMTFKLHGEQLELFEDY